MADNTFKQILDNVIDGDYSNIKCPDLISPSYYIDLMRNIGCEKVKKLLTRRYGKEKGKSIYKRLALVLELYNTVNNRCEGIVYGNRNIEYTLPKIIPYTSGVSGKGEFKTFTNGNLEGKDYNFIVLFKGEDNKEDYDYILDNLLSHIYSQLRGIIYQRKTKVNTRSEEHTSELQSQN